MCANKVEITVMNKSTDVTFKRGFTSNAVSAPGELAGASLKKLPGKRKPPTSTLKGPKSS